MNENKFNIIFPGEIEEKIKIPKACKYSIICPNKTLSSPTGLHRPDRKDCKFIYFWDNVYYCRDEIEFV